MEKCGLVSVSFRKNSPEDIVKLMKKADLSFVEWGSDVHVPEGNERHAELVRRLTEQAGIEDSSYGTYYRLGQNQNIKPYIKGAAALHTKILRLWAGTKGSAEATEDERAAWVAEAKSVCRKAAEHDLKIDFEYHPNTLTDDAGSAKRLMEEINEPNVGLYWQPDYRLSKEQNLAAIEKVKEYVDILHLFYWGEKGTVRLPLADGADELKAYIAAFSDKPTKKLLEFVPNDDIEILPREAETLYSILKSVGE